MQPEFFRRARSCEGGAGLTDLDETLAVLASRGHAGVLDYPLGVFFAALEKANG